jgi:hypothetical protein
MGLEPLVIDDASREDRAQYLCQRRQKSTESIPLKDPRPTREHMVRMSFAGPLAQRRFSSRSIRRFHEQEDYEKAVDLVEYFVGSDEELEAYIHLLEVQAKSFLNRPGVWDQITAPATALLKETTLTSGRVRRIVRAAF